MMTFIRLMDYNIETYRRGPGHLAHLYNDVQAIGLSAMVPDKINTRILPPPPFRVFLPSDPPPPLPVPILCTPSVLDHGYSQPLRSLIIYTDGVLWHFVGLRRGLCLLSDRLIGPSPVGGCAPYLLGLLYCLPCQVSLSDRSYGHHRGSKAIPLTTGPGYPPPGPAYTYSLGQPVRFNCY